MKVTIYKRSCVLALLEPDISFRSKSFQIPLGQSSIVYITPTAREIDDTGKELTETQRNCRLTEENDNLNIFKPYTQEACLLECKIKEAAERCGCISWEYPSLQVLSIIPKFKYWDNYPRFKQILKGN